MNEFHSQNRWSKQVQCYLLEPDNVGGLVGDPLSVMLSLISRMLLCLLAIPEVSWKCVNVKDRLMSKGEDGPFLELESLQPVQGYRQHDPTERAVSPAPTPSKSGFTTYRRSL
jgi:hypothetical protein